MAQARRQRRRSAKGDSNKLMYNLWLAFDGTAQPLPGARRARGSGILEDGFQTSVDPPRRPPRTPATENVAHVPDWAGGEPESPVPPTATSTAPDQATQGARRDPSSPRVSPTSAPSSTSCWPTSRSSPGLAVGCSCGPHLTPKASYPRPSSRRSPRRPRGRSTAACSRAVGRAATSCRRPRRPGSLGRRRPRRRASRSPGTRRPTTPAARSPTVSTATARSSPPPPRRPGRRRRRDRLDLHLRRPRNRRRLQRRRSLRLGLGRRHPGARTRPRRRPRRASPPRRCRPAACSSVDAEHRRRRGHRLRGLRDGACSARPRARRSPTRRSLPVAPTPTRSPPSTPPATRERAGAVSVWTTPTSRRRRQSTV